MPELNIKIQPKEERDKPIFPDAHEIIETQVITIAILEHGTVGGKTSLGFCLHYPGGEIRFAQMTASLFEGLYGAYAGAQLRWGQPFDHFNLVTSTDAQSKLLNAGFTLYRFSWSELEGSGKITYVSKPGAWKLHSKGYNTKAALERKKKELLADPKALEG